ncbi:SWIM zinc finger family protein [Desulfovirgula thermocuniculi]|uniref:SWIM zinc finger family protein n=1 Tax=Desulfovirgula thermocuniculi TaxID=348842 RepID=UPI00041E31FF|nr:SWIM zinc finger family protein [Desulfovirgula thermocuniculi]
MLRELFAGADEVRFGRAVQGLLARQYAVRVVSRRKGYLRAVVGHVEAKTPYAVELFVADDQLVHRCTCPDYERGGGRACKHVLMVAMFVVAERVERAAARGGGEARRQQPRRRAGAGR